MTEGPFFFRELRHVETRHEGSLYELELLGPKLNFLNDRFNYKDIIKLAEEHHVLDDPILHVFERRVGSLRDLEIYLKSFHPRTWSLKDLDSFVGMHSVTAFLLHVTLLKIPPSKVYDQFGINALLWVVANIPDFDFYRFNPIQLRSKYSKQEVPFDQRGWFKELKERADNYISFCSGILRFNKEQNRDLRKAISACNRWLHPEHSSRAQTMIRNFFLLTNLKEQEITTCCDLARKLQSPFYTDPSVSKKRKMELSLAIYTPMGARDYGDYISAHDVLDKIVDSIPRDYVLRVPYMDSPISLVLLWKDKPQAVISFLASDPRTITIVQIQGVVGKVWEAHRDSDGTLIKKQKLDDAGAPVQRGSRGLIGLKWDLLLTRLVEELAKYHGFTAVQIIPGRDNPWIGSEKGRKGFYAMEANRYNAVAEKMGYSLNLQLAVWQHELGEDQRIIKAIREGKTIMTPRAEVLRAELTGI